MQFSAYLHFNGNCKQAFAYYQKHLGGEIPMSMTYGEAPGEMSLTDATRDLIIHTRLVMGDFTLMGSDYPPSAQTPIPMQGFNITFNVLNTAEAERVFKALSVNGEVRQPLTETFFAHRFGMVTDQFGLPWMVIYEKTA